MITFFAAALQLTIVLQTNVIEKVSCGAGCHRKVEQLTPMVEIGDSWRKIKVKHTSYLYHRERGWEQRAHREPLGSGVGTHWNYSNCKTNIFTVRRKEYFSPPPPSKEAWEVNQNAILSNGMPNFYAKNGSVFQRWRSMCPETEAARKGSEEVRAWWDRVINSIKDEEGRIDKEKKSSD